MLAAACTPVLLDESQCTQAICMHAYRQYVYLTNRFRVHCNRSQMIACKEQKSTTRDEVEWRDCCSLHAVASSVIYYSTHTRKNVIYLIYTVKNSKGLLNHF